MLIAAGAAIAKTGTSEIPVTAAFEVRAVTLPRTTVALAAVVLVVALAKVPTALQDIALNPPAVALVV